MMVLSLSDPHPVKYISFGFAWMSPATFFLASSMAFLEILPMLYKDEGFPYFSVKYGIISCKTSSFTFVVAALSKYLIFISLVFLSVFSIIIFSFLDYISFLFYFHQKKQVYACFILPYIMYNEIHTHCMHHLQYYSHDNSHSNSYSQQYRFLLFQHTYALNY